MKKFSIAFVVMLAVFVTANAASYFIRSDGHGLPGVNDGIRRVGFPFLAWEEGGFAYRHSFSYIAVVADIVFALIISGVFALVVSRFGVDGPTSRSSE